MLFSFVPQFFDLPQSDPLNYADLPYDPLHYLDAVIYDREIKIIPHPTLSLDLYQQQNKPQCTNVEEMAVGRWVQMVGKKCPSWACYVNKDSPQEVSVSSIGIEWLTDRFLFNDNYVWVPLNCSVALVSPPEIKRCLVKKNLTDLLFVGDSLVREHFQNLVSYLFPGFHLKRLQGTLATLHFPIPLTGPDSPMLLDDSTPTEQDHHFHLRVHYSYDSPTAALCSFINSNSSLLLWNLQIIRFLNQGDPIFFSSSFAVFCSFAYMFSSCSFSSLCSITPHPHTGPHFNDIKKYNWGPGLAKHFNRDTCSSPSPPPNTYLIHPRIQRLDLRRPRTANPHRGITPLRQDLVNQNLMKALSIVLPNTSSLNAMAITSSRWESSWDGTHYSILADQSVFKTMNVTGLSGLSQTTLDVQVVTNSSQYRQGGRDVCHLRQYPLTHNVCHNGTMYWKTREMKSMTFDSFQGGVSQMLTMMWINSFCHHE
jgi:hypothetical protein